MMSNPLQLRTLRAEELARAYAANDDVAAVLLTGSCARAQADAHSDVELHVFWSSAPREDERNRPFMNSGATLATLWPREDEEWSDKYVVGSLGFDVSHFLVTTVDSHLRAVLESFEADLEKQLLLSAVLGGKALYERSPPLLASFRSRAALYPRGLQLAMMEAHFSPHRRWPQRHALASRDDWLCLQELLVDAMRRVLLGLSGLNCVYVEHPSFKWLSALIPRLVLAPVDLERRLRTVVASAPYEAVLELEQVIDESCDLVARELSLERGARIRTSFSERRPVLSGDERS